SSFSAFAIGFLAGFGSYQVMLKLDELIKQIFGKASEGKPKTPPDEEKPEEANPAPSTPE
ncbi:MAG: hypothetical protein HY740_02635, partial [Chloroflexi bacterium]|nr:hypothetical protein [Chloroflexota bacterium]